MRVWRIGKLSVSDKLSGVGGLHVSGRWHHRGHRILYTSQNASMAVLEVLVHVDPVTVPSDLGLLEIDVPDDMKIESCDAAHVSRHWQDYPFPHELQDFGTRWLVEKRSALLMVASALIPVEQNYLINPDHPDAGRISIVSEQPFAFDARLLKH